jgi:hypothetical protein
MNAGLIGLLVYFGILILPSIMLSIYNFFRYKKKLSQVIHYLSRFSFEKVERSILFYSKKAKSLEQKLYRESGIIKKNIEKGDDFIFWEKEFLKSLGKFSDEDWKPSEWRTKWDCFYIKKEKDLELNLRKLFSPD